MNAIYKGKLYRMGEDLNKATLIDDVKRCDCGMFEAFEECDCPRPSIQVSFGDPELIIDPTDDQINNLLPDWEADLCPINPDKCWIDRDTGEHVNADTNKRTKNHE